MFNNLGSKNTEIINIQQQKMQIYRMCNIQLLFIVYYLLKRSVIVLQQFPVSRYFFFFHQFIFS